MNAAPEPGQGGELERRVIRDLEHLPGVLAAALWLNGGQRVRALHVTAAPEASGLIIANAAAQILRHHGLSFEMDVIRVAFRDRPHRPDPRHHTETPKPSRFLLLHDLSIARAASRVTCRVAVRRDEVIFDGEAVELDTEGGRIRAAARATLSAAEHADPNLALGLEGTTLLDIFGRRYVAVSVEAAIDRRFAVLAGLVPVDPSRSHEEAGCLAALRAIDRWISW